MQFLSETEAAFTDLEGHWAQLEIQRAVDYGLFEGAGDTCFHPDDTVSRAMLAQVLLRMSRYMPLSISNRFSDVPDGAWYSDAANTLSGLGVIEGSDGRFYPEMAVTREQLAAMLYRYEQTKTQTPPAAEGDLLAFADGDQVSGWAKDAMLWMVSQGLLTGASADTLAPQASLTRAQMAVILVRYLERGK